MPEIVTTRPILFSGPMVRALRENRKTVTRRMRGLGKINADPDAWEYLFLNAEDEHVFQRIGATENSTVFMRCPYGVAGDRLWTRECWRGTEGEAETYEYRADTEAASNGWRPSIHMPRVASRDTLEVVRAKPERLQCITESDAMAEGVEPFSITQEEIDEIAISDESPETKTFWKIMGPGTISHVHEFHVLWEEINGADSWDKNPWVWVVTFRRLEERGK